MGKMGLIDPAWKLTERDAPPWDKLPKAQRDELDYRMAIYAAMVDRMDQNIGRVVQQLDEVGDLENTLILFLSDNGGCAEGGKFGGGPAEQLGTEEGYFLTYGKSWANASNTPFQKYKHWVHEGGIATPLIAHWPERIKRGGEVTHEIGHIIDLMATCTDVAGAAYPEDYNGNRIPPLEGTSLIPAFDRKPLQREPLFWEHEGNRAVRIGKWKLVAAHNKTWQLYDMTADRTETNDLAPTQPDIHDDMLRRYDKWAKRCGVLPWRPERKPGFTPPKLVYPKTIADTGE